MRLNDGPEPVEQFHFQAISHINEGAENGGVIPDGGGWIGEAPVDPLGGTRENRAVFGGVVADRHYEVESGVQILPQVVGAMAGDIDASLAHGLNRKWIDARGLGAGAVDLDCVASEMTQQAFAHLGTGGVCRAEDKDL